MRGRNCNFPSVLPKALAGSPIARQGVFTRAPMIKNLISRVIARTIEAWDDWRDPDWNPKYDPYEGLINNPTPRQIEKMYPKKQSSAPHDSDARRRP